MTNNFIYIIENLFNDESFKNASYTQILGMQKEWVRD